MTSVPSPRRQAGTKLARLAAAAGVLLLAAGASLAAVAAGAGRAWAAGAALVVLLVAAAGWAIGQHRDRRRARQLEAAVAGQAPASGGDALRERLRLAMRTLRRSRLGQAHGHAALYALPWYVVIGEPAAGKSSAVLASGLGFPFDGSGTAVGGVGGTRDCDWFFGSEAIVLDTAGRYAVQPEDHDEWLEFLRLLRRARPRAPLDGVVVVASVAELARLGADGIVALARRLRSRVHELSERLEIVMPVYLVFTKADLVDGFEPFFADADDTERERIWGSTLPCRDAGTASAAQRFEAGFAALRQGLRERALARLGAEGGAAAPQVLGFTLEFAALEPALTSFVATLFDDDPYHLRPLLRGFYFTSALQSGQARPMACAAVAQRFGLAPDTVATAARRPGPSDGRPFFLHPLFGRVLGGDRGLVRRQASPRRRRLQRAGFAASLLLVAVALGGMSTSYLANRSLVADTAAELERLAARASEGDDPGPRLAALEGLQQRLQALQAWRGSAPWSLRWGLYQGEALESRLQADYHAGLQALLLAPAAQALERELEAFAGRDPASPPSGDGDADAAYGALKAYLMLAEPGRREAAHLKDQLTPRWRDWLAARRGAALDDETLRRAQAVAAFALSGGGEAVFPPLPLRATLVDAVRRRLHTARDTRPPEERVYAEIRERAAARYAPVTLAGLLGAADDTRAPFSGGEVVSGVYTAEAWHGLVEPAIRAAAEGTLQRQDWVLDTTTSEDLSLRGSPQRIREDLSARYRREHAAAWQRFADGLSVGPFAGPGDAAAALERLADPALSPLRRLVLAIARQTPAAEQDLAPAVAGGLAAWARHAIGGVTPGAQAATPVAGRASGADIAAALADFAAPRPAGEAPAALARYEAALGRVRTRMQALAQSEDPGPGARDLLAATLADTENSELAAALRLSEELLAAVPTGARSLLRPLLVRPLSASVAVLVPPAEAELNRRWQAEVHDGFARSLAARYPFAPGARVEAAAEEILRVFGPAGSIARFTDTALGPLVLRRGDTIEPRRWGDLGVRLRAEFTRGVPGWLAADGVPGAGREASTAFQLRPLPSPALVEYTVEIDGQTLRYRNAAAGWADFVWPHSSAAPGVRIRGTTADGAAVVFVDAPGAFGLDRAFELADRRRQDDGSTELAWTQDGHTLRLRLRLVRAAAGAGAAGAWRGLQLPALVAGPVKPEPGNTR